MLFRTGRRATRCAPWLLSVLMLACVPAQADTGSLNVAATVLSRSLCRFTTDPQPLAFGAINPTSTVAATATTQLTFGCLGFFGTTTYTIRAGNGLNSAGAGLRQVRHTSSATSVMAYSLSLTPASGTINNFLATQTVVITGSIAPTEFQNARTGTYSDTVVLELDP